MRNCREVLRNMKIDPTRFAQTFRKGCEKYLAESRNLKINRGRLGQISKSIRPDLFRLSENVAQILRKCCAELRNMEIYPIASVQITTSIRPDCFRRTENVAQLSRRVAKSGDRPGRIGADRKIDPARVSQISKPTRTDWPRRSE